MATAPSGTRLAESLKRVYEELHIANEDIECLTNYHQIWNSQDLGMKRQRLELKELAGVSESAQTILEVVAKYVGSKAVNKFPDPLANFTRKEYYEYVVESDDIDYSAATDHDVTTRRGTKDNPFSCDSIVSEEEAEGTVTFMGCSSPNPSFLRGRLPITFVKIQGDLANTLGAVTSSSNTRQSQDGKPVAKNFPDDPEGDELNEPERGPLAESETVKDIDESDNFDLSEEERQAEMARIRDSKLNMMMQGFEYSPLTDAYERKPDDSTLDAEESYARADGLELRTGNCYHYQRQEGGSQVILGIISFKAFEDKKIMAKCVLVVPYSVTFLGEERVENPSLGGVGGCSDFFQVRKDLGLFPLSSFTGECIEPTTIPKMIYEPKTLASPHTFGYIYDNKGNNRVGPRMETRVLDLFCGAGGMHQGYKNAGFKTAMAVDIDQMAMETFKANNPDVPVYKGDVKRFLEDFKTNDDFRQGLVGRCDVVHASPPCSAFSSLNRKKTGEVYLANRELSKTTFIECIRELDPKVAIYENVEGILQRQSSDVFTHIVTELIRMGYQVRSTVLKACDFGDPQVRRRLIIFAAKSFVPMPSLPLPTHGDGPSLLPYVTAKNVLERLRYADPDKIPNIKNCKNTMICEGVHGVVKLDANKLAPAVRARGPPVLHYAEDRCLNVRENATLQGFQYDYKFSGNLPDMYGQVGNAVPLKLGTAIARSAKDCLEFEYDEESEMTSA